MTEDYMYIGQEPAGVISQEPVWICACEGYLYIASTLEELIEILNTEWRH